MPAVTGRGILPWWKVYRHRFCQCSHSNTVVSKDFKCKCTMNNYGAVYISAGATVTRNVSHSYSKCAFSSLLEVCFAIVCYRPVFQEEPKLIKDCWVLIFWLRSIYKMDNYPLILSQMLLCYIGSGDISLVRTVKLGVSAFNSRRKDW